MQGRRVYSFRKSAGPLTLDLPASAVLALPPAGTFLTCHGLGSFHLVCAFPCSIPGAHLGPVTLPALPVRRHGPWLSR